jgi:hypothetical protein
MSAYKNELLTFFGTIFPDEFERKLFLKSCADIFLSDNNKTLYVWVGCGNNGKHTVLELFEMLLKNTIEYLFTDYISKGCKNTGRELINIKNNTLCKLIYINEKYNFEIDCEKTRHLLNNDHFYVNNKSYEPLNKPLLLITNGTHIINDFDKRLIAISQVFNFRIIFTDKSIDYNILDKFKENIEEYKEALLQILNDVKL